MPHRALPAMNNPGDASSAALADGLPIPRHDSNQELMAQGAANVFCPLLGGVAANGAIARTAANIRTGARSLVEIGAIAFI